MGGTSDQLSRALAFRVDVSNAMSPMLLSQQALTRVRGCVNSPNCALELPGLFTAQLTTSSAGHVLSPGIITREALARSCKSVTLPVCPIRQPPSESRKLTDAELLKIHQQLGHCSEKQLAELLKSGRCKVDTMQMRRITHRRNCQRSAHRVTHPVVSSWIARFSGEIAAIDIVRPFADIGPGGLFPFGRATGNRPALLVADSLTRFTTCQLRGKLTSLEAPKTFMNDWAKHFGQPKRIILGQ